jgi:hypothetical protein
MAVSVRASKEGLAIVDLARKKKKWTKTAVVWYETALVGKAALRRFWGRIPINTENFVSICQAVGVNNWEAIVESTYESPPMQAPEVGWLLEVKATIAEVDKPLIDELIKLISYIQQRSPNAFVKTQKIDLGSIMLIENWQPVESVLPPSRTRSRSPVLEDSIGRGKEIDLGEDRTVVLVVERTLKSEEEVGLTIEVYPASNASYLPPGLSVKLINESETIIFQEQAGRTDDLIKIEVSLEPEELLGLELALGDVSITEYF